MTHFFQLSLPKKRSSQKLVELQSDHRVIGGPLLDPGRASPTQAATPRSRRAGRSHNRAVPGASEITKRAPGTPSVSGGGRMMLGSKMLTCWMLENTFGAKLWDILRSVFGRSKIIVENEHVSSVSET